MAEIIAIKSAKTSPSAMLLTSDYLQNKARMQIDFEQMVKVGEISSEILKNSAVIHENETATNNQLTHTTNFFTKARQNTMTIIDQS